MKKIIFILTVCLMFIACNNGIKQMDTPFTHSYNTPLNVFDTISWVNSALKYDECGNKDSLFVEYEDRQLHVKYENHTLWAYYDISNVKTFNDIVYTDYEETFKTDTGLDVVRQVARLFYNINTGDIVLITIMDYDVLYETDAENKEYLENINITAYPTFDGIEIKYKNVNDLK